MISIRLNIFRGLLFLLTPLFLSACVSIDIGNKKSSKAENLQYQTPTSPFISSDSPLVDKSWKNPGNGNSISFLSECHPSYDPSLIQMQEGILSGLQEVKILKEKNFTYNGRAALRSHVRGQVDGVASELDLLVFKKNGCSYVLTYVALPNSFDRDHRQYEEFLNSFKAP